MFPQDILCSYFQHDLRKLTQRVKTYRTECHDISEFFLFVLQINVKTKSDSAKSGGACPLPHAPQMSTALFSYFCCGYCAVFPSLGFSLLVFYW